MTSLTARRTFDAAVAGALDQASPERHRLERLLQLRAVIDSIRAERALEGTGEPGVLIRRQAG
jgi:hypothetical protein